MAFDKGYALIIGVGTYKNILNANIPVSVKDAEAVRTVLCDPELCGYLPENVKFLHDETANRDRIRSELDELAKKTTDENTVALFYCGHGQHGTDGKYYLTAHDSEVSNKRVVTGTGISETELLEHLRKIPAKRLLMLFNSCYSGEISPALSFGEPESFGGTGIPPITGEAVLSSGEGRIMITACRPEQKSWIGTGKLSIFAQALVDGLSGKGYMYSNNGYVSAFGLYEHIYSSVREAAAKIGHTQEPELTVLKGVGPFPVSLFRGATDLSAFDIQEPLPPDTLAREIDPGRSRRWFNRIVTIGGSVNNSVIIAGDGNVVRKS